MVGPAESFLGWIFSLLLKLRELFYKSKKARADALSAEIQLSQLQREQAINTMEQAIERLIDETRQKYPGRTVWPTKIEPGPNDDPDIFRESMDRIKKRYPNAPFAQ